MQKPTIIAPAKNELQRDRDALELSRRLALGRIAAYFGFGVGTLWLVFLAVVGDFIGGTLAATVMLFNLLTLLLFHYGRHLCARLFWILSSGLLAFGCTLVLPGAAQVELLFLVYIGLPFLLFSWRNERVPLALCGLVMAVLAFLAFVNSTYDFSGQIGIPLITQEPAEPVVRLLLLVSVAALVAVELGYFAYYAERASDEVSAALRDARQAYLTKSRFLANMSHEIRTPMNGIIGTIDILEHSGIRSNQQRSMSTIRESAFSLLRIVDDVLDASKIEADKLDIVATRTDLPELIEQVTLTLVPLSSSHGVRQRLFIDRDLPVWVETDGVRVRQILLNVISNAIKYSASGLTGRAGEVVIFARPSSDGFVEIEVADNGIGMDDELARTFCEPFVQGQETLLTKIRGTGLGMSITSRLIGLLNGRLQVRTQVDNGTTISVQLPYGSGEQGNRLPDLSGLHVIALGTYHNKLQQGLGCVLGKGGVRLSFAADYADLMAQGVTVEADAIFLLLPDTPAQIEALQTAIWTDHPHAAMLVSTSDRSQLLERLGPQVYQLPVHPMMRSDLYTAIAELAGRAMPLPFEAAPDNVFGESVPPADRLRKALIVDDNSINLHVLKAQMELLGHHAITAGGGREALELWKTGDFDMLITDCEMPDMSGFALTRAIRSLELQQGNRRVPVLAVTANIEHGDKEKFQAAGMDGYLLKPLALNDLKHSIDSLT